MDHPSNEYAVLQPHFAPAPVISGASSLLGAGSLYQGALWRIGSRERPKQIRDSLRSRSKEGRPGSRKHRRHSQSVELVSSLRRVMSARGEDNLPTDVDAVVDERPEQRPSAFYRLLEHEGPDALEAWAAAESRRRTSSRPRQRRAKDAASLAEEQKRQVRRAFRDTWQYLSRDSSSQELIAKLEAVAESAFGTCIAKEEEGLLWHLSWDGDELTTESGAPPAEEMVLQGLDGAQRKVVHQLARLIGLHSESRVLEEDHTLATERKVLALRPPRRLSCRSGAWAAPFSVAEVIRPGA
eukprot:TRINITY_DN17770_c1_g1_i1.p1 TRINITY_DN17770_c1_g1~~TRINITY_DN17770_c1_g1_i1.p1  ORF type:complete len:297 (-),score=55.20 TRINITY_DN17770_c1_g1_i1:133-1023(-)